MTIAVKVKPSSKHESIKQISETEYEVSISPPPLKGRANCAIIKLLAKHFNTSPSNVTITQGLTSHNKTIEIQR